MGRKEELIKNIKRFAIEYVFGNPPENYQEISDFLIAQGIPIVDIFSEAKKNVEAKIDKYIKELVQ